MKILLFGGPKDGEVVDVDPVQRSISFASVRRPTDDGDAFTFPTSTSIIVEESRYFITAIDLCGVTRVFGLYLNPDRTNVTPTPIDVLNIGTLLSDLLDAEIESRAYAQTL